MQPKLLAITGPLEGQTFELDELPYFLGRGSSNHLQLRQSSVSRRHCVIERRDGELVVRDRGSRHGTFVNGRSVRLLPLDHRQLLKVGGSVFLLLLRPDPGAEDGAGADLYLDDGDSLAESTVLLPARDTHKRWLDHLRTALEPSAGERQLAALLEICAALPSLSGVEPLARRLLELVAEVIPAQRLALWLADEGQGELRAVYPEGASVRLSRTASERAMEAGEAVLSNDVTGAFDRAESLHAAHIRSLICAPLLVSGRALGVLYADTQDPGQPFRRDHLELVAAVAAVAAVPLANARYVAWLEGENRRLRLEGLDHDLVGTSAPIRKALRFISRVAPLDATVLVRGESGTGKELVARAIHRNSPRRDRSFVAINCAVLSEELLESELFGHEKGAFTGAVRQKPGQLEVADGGTVFLDEVGEMPPRLQAKLLRVLDEHAFQHVGGTRRIEVDIRLVAATNRDLEQAMKDGDLRQDLFYRLNVISLTLPPLRRRREDILLLANHFAARYSRRHQRRVSGISAPARRCLEAYDWPGNVRELANAIERAVVLGQEDLVLPEDLPDDVCEVTGDGDAELGYQEAVRSFQRRLIRDELERSGGNYPRAAERLGLSPNYLHRLARKLGLKD